MGAFLLDDQVAAARPKVSAKAKAMKAMKTTPGSRARPKVAAKAMATKATMKAMKK